ncbi:ECs_2282 family putative zinc-binding protein [Sphingopyxis sp. NJF-3]
MTDDASDRTLALQCPTCGSEEFRFGEPEAPVICDRCERSFAREELVRENGERAEAAFEELAPDLLREAADTLRSGLKKALKGSKSLTFK